MSLLFPLLLAVIVCGLAALIAWVTWAEALDEGFEFLALLIGAAFFAPLAAVGYGVYGWLRFGKWAAISVDELLQWMIGLGFDVGSFSSHIEWAGVNRISDIYLTSNVGWTAFAVLMAAWHVSDQLHDYLNAKKRAATAEKIA